MKSKKLLSLLLALMMMLSVVPMYASAADPIALTEANVTVWPTASGEIYFGQKLSDGITLSGGEVQYDGAVVEGQFEFVNPDYYPDDAYEADRASIKFVPDNTSVYTGFSIIRSKNVTYKVKAVTPVFVDENNPPVASEVVAGAQLRTSTISGGEMKNPYNESEANIADTTWTWTSRRTVINESGYHEAEFAAPGYEIVTRMLYVKVAGEASPITITEAPTVEAMTYDVNRTYADITFVGGKAVDAVTGEEVAGTFAFTNTALNSTVPSVGTRELEVTFTPNDTEKYLSSTTTITVTVNPAKVAFIDETGAETIPEITIPYGFKMGDDLNGYLRPYLNASASLNFTETEYYNTVVPVGTHDLTVKTICDDPNYERENTLPFKLTVEPVEADVEIKHTVNNDDKNTYELYVIGSVDNTVRPQGTYALYVDGQLLKDGVAYGEHITWSPEKSKSYELKAVYTPKDNDPCIVADVVSTIDAKLYRKVTTINTSSDGEKEFRCGETIRVVANIPEFIGWVITDAAGNTVDLGVDLTAKTIEFAVPDYDITIEAKSNSSSDDGNEGDDNTTPDIDIDLDTDGSHKFDFVNLIKNLIAQLKAFIQQIGDFFNNMSLDSLGEVIG